MPIYNLFFLFLILSAGCGGKPVTSDAVLSLDSDNIVQETGSQQVFAETKLTTGPSYDDSVENRPGVIPIDFFSVAELSDSLFATIDGVSFRKGAPVRRADLREVMMLHHDFDGNVRVGRIICHKSIAKDILEIFKELYEIGYPIESVMPVDNFGGDDNESMKANNTSCFNYRPTPGGSRLSHHAYGTAIDINPLINPYVRRTRRGTVVLPEEGRRYVDRSLGLKGMLTPDDPCVVIFKKHGFRWGGDWRRDTRDYQHFEKPLKSK